MKILLTNDDGCHAPGIATLFRVAGKYGELILVAPRNAISGSSHQVTTDRPLGVQSISPDQYAVDGSPADCVRLGVLQLMPDVEWVFSGINDGGNMGVDVWMSGTVAAAREAALLGRKAMAISQYRRRQLPFQWDWAGCLTEQVIHRLLRRPLPTGCFWNVNLPADFTGTGPLPEVVFCPLDPNPLPVMYAHHDGQFLYRGNYHDRLRRVGSDVDVCFSGRVAVSLVSAAPS